MFRFSRGFVAASTGGSAKRLKPDVSVDAVLSKADDYAKKVIKAVSDPAADPAIYSVQREEIRKSYVRAEIDGLNVPEAATEELQRIDDIAAVPKGHYKSMDTLPTPVSSMFNESFVLIENERNHLLLCAEVATHAYFELLKRLKANDILPTEKLLCSREIIKSLNEANTAKTRVTGPETSAESQAWALIESAAEKNASDIHIETRSGYAEVFFRIYGERVPQPIMSAQSARDIANTLYTVHADDSGKASSWGIETVHQGAIEHILKDGTRVQLRFSSGPIHPAGNFHVVMRLLTMDAEHVKSLAEVGYEDSHIKQIEEMLIGSTGLVLLAGPVNSGKSTSLQAFIQRIYERRGVTTKVITVEDPVEYVIPRACQMGVPTGRKQLEDGNGSIFNTFLKGSLRQDPDVVMVGEIRDSESAEAVKNLVLAGRKTLSTLHVSDSFGVFPRLRELQVPPSVLTSKGFISGILYQRLVPALCQHCAIDLMEAAQLKLIEEDLVERVTRVVDLADSDVKVRNHDGCEHCKFTGISGRALCVEVLSPTDEILAQLRASNDIEAKRIWKDTAPTDMDGRGPSALAHAIHLMCKGLLDPHDIEVHIESLNKLRN